MKRFLSLLILIIPVLLFSQDKDSNTPSGKKVFPVQAVSTDLFKLYNLSFNKMIPGYAGEVLEVEFQLKNMIEMPHELYIFVIATYEKSYKTDSSFQSPSLDDPEQIKNIKVFPDDLSNFEYTEKDQAGNDKKVYIKYPKNIKAGVNPETGKPYFLDDNFTFRTKFLSKYARRYYYFNEIAILIFDNKEELIYREVFKVKEKKR
ncbi:MAG TPA: hypothetical protein PK293_06085 [Spirochaetota bacterium]|nr:hypothetical protein [Spirochaetota bacterium]HPF05588.1 hypothetical protein [Spirochaetota bacterium]HPJ41551.1 hypothetical protein [Spirochaetota bacterium]HPR36913.1 hypothetical protein [Spirochaetota bacterium]